MNIFRIEAIVGELLAILLIDHTCVFLVADAAV